MMFDDDAQFDEMMRRGMGFGGDEPSIPSLAEKAMAIAARTGKHHAEPRQRRQSVQQLITAIAAAAILTIVGFGLPSLSGLFGNHQVVSMTDLEFATEGSWGLSLVVLAGLTAFSGIIAFASQDMTNDNLTTNMPCQV